MGPPGARRQAERMTIDALTRRSAPAAAAYIAIFCLVAGGGVAWSLAHGTSWSAVGVVLLAISLRLVTIAIALASVQPWGRLLPSWLILAGLWGAAAVQLIYPVAETVVKALILLHVIDPINKGISNMTAQGWFNFGAMWVVFGIPGILFLLSVLSYRARHRVPARWVALGILGGAILLGGLGFIIG
jgi:hypothetical protein